MVQMNKQNTGHFVKFLLLSSGICFQGKERSQPVFLLKSAFSPWEKRRRRQKTY